MNTMENLLSSRISQMHESPIKLQNLSPQKYGKGAYADLCFTPSKLANNVLYKQVTILKKYEGDSNKLREFQAMHSFLRDRIRQIEEQRDGLAESLNIQIVMYKRMLHEMQVNQETRLKEMQKKFGTEIHRLIAEKEEEAKYSQAELELLEKRIFQMERISEDLRDRLTHTGGNLEDLTNQHEKLNIQFNNLTEKSQKTEQRMREDLDKAKQEYQTLSRKAYNAQVDWQNKLQNTVHNKNKEIENLDRLQRTELEKLENKRASQNLMRNQEMKDIKQTFENQSKRLNEIVGMKDRMVESLTKQNNKQKATILELTKHYEKQVNDLGYEKTRLKENIEKLNQQITVKDLQAKDSQTAFSREKSAMQAYSQKLKQQLELTQLNFIRERDHGSAVTYQLQMDLARFKIENDGLATISHENNMLLQEVRNLRELLVESSIEMERCKDQFLRTGCQRDQLVIRMKEIGFQNDALLRIKIERDQEERGWKENYFLNRMRN